MALYVVDNATLKAENPPPPGTSPPGRPAWTGQRVGAPPAVEGDLGAGDEQEGQ